MSLLEALARAMHIPELRRKLVVTVGLLVIFRALASISIPGADPNALSQLFSNNSLLGILNLFSGGGLSNFSIVAAGLNPFITATIIMQLMTVVSLRLKDLSKQGDQGRQKMTQYTRWLTVPIAAAQAFSLAVVFSSPSAGVLRSPGVGTMVSIVVTLVAGTIIVMWLGELISEYGIGNGVSIMIFAGIISRVPGVVFSYGSGGGAHLFQLFLVAAIAVATAAFIIEIQQARRKIPIQSAQRVLNPRTGEGTATRRNFLPLSLNAAGVIPIIFALSIMAFPTLLSGLFENNGGWIGALATKVRTYWQPNGGFLWVNLIYNVIYFLLILGFTYFYTYIQFQPDEVADDFKKRSIFIPGIRPGRNTAEYLHRVMGRITLAGAIFLAVITVLLPLITSFATGVSTSSLYLGGTAILIVVSVALDTMKQIETQLLMRHYRGFIK